MFIQDLMKLVKQLAPYFINKSTKLLNDSGRPCISNGVAEELCAPIVTGKAPTRTGQIAVTEAGALITSKKKQDGSYEWNSSSSGGVTSFKSRVGDVSPESGDYDTSNVTETTDKKYVTDEEKTKLSLLSGTNSGDETGARVSALINGASDVTGDISNDHYFAMSLIGQSGLYKTSFDNLKRRISLAYTAEDSANKASDFSTLNNTKYPTTQAVKTLFDSIGGSNELVTATATLTSNMNFGSQSDYMTILSLANLPAGKYLFFANINVIRSATTAQTWRAYISNGSTILASGRSYNTSVSGAGNSITFHAVVELTATATITLKAKPTTFDSSSVISATAESSIGGATTLTAIRIDNIKGADPYTLPKATASILGGVKVGDNLSIDSEGVLSATSGGYTLPTASDTVKGGVKIGSGLTMTGEVLSATGGGGSSVWGGITGDLNDQSDLKDALALKQDTLVSGTNIKTINGNSVLGSGNLDIEAALGDNIDIGNNNLVSGAGNIVTGDSNTVDGDFNIVSINSSNISNCVRNFIVGKGINFDEVAESIINGFNINANNTGGTGEIVRSSITGEDIRVSMIRNSSIVGINHFIKKDPDLKRSNIMVTGDGVYNPMIADAEYLSEGGNYDVPTFGSQNVKFTGKKIINVDYVYGNNWTNFYLNFGDALDYIRMSSDTHYSFFDVHFSVVYRLANTNIIEMSTYKMLGCYEYGQYGTLQISSSFTNGSYNNTGALRYIELICDQNKLFFKPGIYLDDIYSAIGNENLIIETYITVEMQEIFKPF